MSPGALGAGRCQSHCQKQNITAVRYTVHQRVAPVTRSSPVSGHPHRRARGGAARARPKSSRPDVCRRHVQKSQNTFLHPPDRYRVSAICTIHVYTDNEETPSLTQLHSPPYRTRSIGVQQLARAPGALPRLRERARGRSPHGRSVRRGLSSPSSGVQASSRPCACRTGRGSARSGARACSPRARPRAA